MRTSPERSTTKSAACCRATTRSSRSLPRAPLGLVSLPLRRTFVGPWAETSNIVTEGDDWEYDDSSYDICAGILSRCSFLLNIVSAATRVPAHVRAGFNSSITWDRQHLLAFDVPANAGRVQVDIEGSHVDLAVDTEDCFGDADGSACTTTRSMRWEATVSSTPSTTRRSPVCSGTSGSTRTTASLTQEDCLPQLAPPALDAPTLNIIGEGDTLLEFTAPPGGGSYVLSAGVRAHAQVFLGGTAISQAQVGVNSVTISHG